MSSTNRGGKRSEADDYQTPEWAVLRLLEALNLPAGHWLEPSVGEGNIVRAAQSYRNDITWTGLDIRPTKFIQNQGSISGTYFVGDFLKPDLFLPRRYDVCIANPPYRFAAEFLEKALTVADTVIMLLRVGFLSSERRADFMRTMTPDVYILPNRPHFTDAGSDSTDYAWMAWPRSRHRKVGRIKVLNSTPKEERAR
jgi:hypothetical protein